MMLEHAISDDAGHSQYPTAYDASTGIIDWAPMLREMVRDIRDSPDVGGIAARFHNALAASIVAVAKAVGIEDVALTGGCFQNAYLAERVIDGLEGAGLRPHWHRRVPPNDGGVALGQLIAGIVRTEGG